MLDKLFHKLIHVDSRGRTVPKYNISRIVFWYCVVMVITMIVIVIIGSIFLSVVALVISIAVSELHSGFSKFQKKNCYPWIDPDNKLKSF